MIDKRNGEKEREMLLMEEREVEVEVGLIITALARGSWLLVHHLHVGNRPLQWQPMHGRGHVTQTRHRDAGCSQRSPPLNSRQAHG